MFKKLLTVLLFSLLFQSISAQNEFITIWKPNMISNMVVTAPYPAGSNQIWFPGIGSNYTINWEEVGYPSHNGTMNNVTSTAQVLIDFGTSLNPTTAQATYKVKVSNGNGSFQKMLPSEIGTTGWIFNGNIDKLMEISQWGNIQWTSMNNAFANCYNVKNAASDIPNLSNVTDMSGMFRNATNFTSTISINNWDTSSVQDMSYLFSATLVFNSPLGNWNTSQVTTMSNMFSNAKIFNQPLNTWQTSKVTDMTALFKGAQAFDQPLNNWNTSMVTSLVDIFSNAKVFNQPINSWDTSKVTDLTGAFGFATNFNQPLNNWNTSNVTKLTRTFIGAVLFNQNINSWNTSKVTDMSYTFSEAMAYNQPLSSWDTSQVTNISYMFHFIPVFNQPIGNWNTGKVTNMEHILHACTAFNQSLEDWDVHAVTNMDVMFTSATSFNYPLEKWNLNSLTTAAVMINSAGMDCINYSKTLVGWANNSNTPNNINLGFVSGLTYSNNIASYRDTLLNSKGWAFTGDISGACEFHLGVSDYEHDNEFSVYPNPATDVLYLKNIRDIKSYKILDFSGRIIIQNSLNSNHISVKELKIGNYILMITTSDKTYAVKFIKQ